MQIKLIADYVETWNSKICLVGTSISVPTLAASQVLDNINSIAGTVAFLTTTVVGIFTILLAIKKRNKGD